MQVMVTISGGDERQPFLDALAATDVQIRALYRDGVVRWAWERRDPVALLLLLEIDSPADAASFVESLPLVVDGAARFEVTELAPYTGFVSSR